MRVNFTNKRTSIAVYDPFYDEWGYVDPSPEKEADMKVTTEIRNSLVEAARVDEAKAQAAYWDADKKLKEAQANTRWAKSLVVGNDLTLQNRITPSYNIPQSRYASPYSDLYFIASKSGGAGHYIEKTGNTISCSCPGFLNRNSCWASSAILSGQRTPSRWLWSKEGFDRERNAAVNEYYQSR